MPRFRRRRGPRHAMTGGPVRRLAARAYRVRRGDERGGAQRQLTLFGPIGVLAATLDSAASERAASTWEVAGSPTVLDWGQLSGGPAVGGGHAAGTQVAGHGPGPRPGAALRRLRPVGDVGTAGGSDPSRADGGVAVAGEPGYQPVLVRGLAGTRLAASDVAWHSAAAAYPRAGHGWPRCQGTSASAGGAALLPGRR